MAGEQWDEARIGRASDRMRNERVDEITAEMRELHQRLTALSKERDALAHAIWGCTYAEITEG